MALASAQPVSELTVHFTVFSAAPIDGLSFVPQPGASPMPVVFYPTARSPRYDYQGANPLKFYRAPAMAAAADEATLAAEVALPLTLHDALLLFTPLAPTTAGGPRYRVYVLDDGAARRAVGGLTIINFSGLVLTGTIGGKTATLNNGLNPSVSLDRSAKILLRTPFKERSYQSYADTVELGPGERALLILFPPYRPGSLEVQSRLLVDKDNLVTPPPIGR